MIHGRERELGLGIELVRPRQLVEHCIVALVLRIGLEQRRVQADRVRGAQALVRHEFAFDALRFRTLEVQVAQPAQRLGAQRRIAGVQIQEAAVAVHGLFGVDALRGRGTDIHLLPFEVLDGGRVLGLREGRGAAPARRDHGRIAECDQHRARTRHGCAFGGGWLALS